MRWHSVWSSAGLLCVFLFFNEADGVTRNRKRYVRGASIRTEDPLDEASWADFLGKLKSSEKVANHVDTTFDSANSAQEETNTSTQLLTNATLEDSVPRQAVVIAKYDEDVRWLKKLPHNFDVLVYQSKNRSDPHYVENYGNEAAKYLTYIVENYDKLPDTVAFMQAGQADWHDPLPKDITMQRWDWGNAAAQGGIAFLPTAAPCLIEDSDPSPASDVSTDAEVAQPQKKIRALVPDEEKCVDVIEHTPPQMDQVRSVWAKVFESELGPLPKRWFTHCCGQFQVTRDAILHHPLDFYQRILQWAMDHDRSLLQSDYGEEMKRNHDADRRDAGHVFEVLWALIFSNPMSRVVISA